MSNLLEQASLVMIPSGYKEDVVYSEIPINGAGDLSLTRASNGTRINSQGLVEVVPWNLLQQSETFDNAGWNKDLGASVTANTTTAPNGTTTADTLTIASGQYMYQGVSLVVAQSYTISVYLRVASGTKQFKFNTYGSGNDFTSSAYTATTEWQRFEYTFTTIASGITNIYPVLVDGLTGGSFFIWGAQLNIGSTAKPYFPTTDRLNVPRLTYQNGGGGCPSLLLEKQSTNLTLWSEDFTQWTASNATVTANNTTSPDGTQNADRIQFTGAGYLLGASQGAGTVYTISCYAKRNGSGTQSIGFFKDGSGTVDSAWALTSDWQRFTYTYTASNGSYSGIAGVNGGDVFVWGAQLEASSYATSYIPTTSSSATRVIDDCRKTGISSLIGQTEGTLFIDLDLTAWDSNSFYFGIYGGGNEIYFRCNSTGEIAFVHYFGSTQALLSKSGLSLGRHKLAACYKNNDWAFYVDGILAGTDTSGSFSGTISQMVFGYTSISVYPPFQSVNQAVLFPTRLTNAELASLTTI